MATEQVVAFPRNAGDSPPSALPLPRPVINPIGDELLASSLREALTRVATPLSARELEGVRELVSRYVVALHNHNWPPERVIMAVKQIAGDAGLRASANQALAESRWTDSDRLLAGLVRWCIAQYYESPVDTPFVRASTKVVAEAPQSA